MNDIIGMLVDEEYLPAFEWVGDIQYFEGPLLSEYKTARGESFVFLWCDCSNDLNRWLAGRTSKRSLYLLTAGLVGIKEFFENELLENNVYVLDTDGDDNIEQARMTHIRSVADQYLPEPGTLISLDLMPRTSAANYYPILIDGQWDTVELTEMPKKFLDIFSLISRYKETGQQQVQQGDNNVQNLTDAPWKGGFSSAFFYSQLRKTFCPDAGIDAIQYASPGYIKFSTDREISLLVKKNLDVYHQNRKEIDRDFMTSSVYLRDEKLNDQDVAPTDDNLRALSHMGESLMAHFAEPTWNWIYQNCPDSFIAIKVARSYVSRLRQLDNYVRSGKTTFAEI